MGNIVIPFGKVLKGAIIGPLKASKDYVKIKINLKKFEKQNDVIPFRKLKKKVFMSNQYFVDMGKEISNPLIKLLHANSSNTTDVYFDENDRPVLSCSYSMKQKLLNKNTTLICNCISTSATANADYYYLSSCIRYNVTTDQTENMLNGLLSKIR